MDKPISLSVKKFLIRKLAVDTMIPEKSIEAVINHQFSTALDAMLHKNTIEFSGFGKFVFSQRKAKFYLEKWLRQEKEYEVLVNEEGLTEVNRHNLSLRLEAIRDNVRTLKARTYETYP